MQTKAFNAPNPSLSLWRFRMFGVKLAVALGLIGLARWWWTTHFPPIQFGIVALILVLAVAFPSALVPVHRAFEWLIHWLNRGMTYTGMGIAFYVVITPAALLHRMFAGDPLKRAIDPKAETYWENPDDQPSDIGSYRNQF